MANVLLVTASTSNAAYTRTKAALEAGGHVVTGLAEASLGSANLTGVQVIADVRATRATVAPWLSARWAEGYPILLGGPENGATNGELSHAGENLGVLTNTFTTSTISQNATTVLTGIVSHAVTTGFAAGSSVTVLAGENYAVRDSGALYGTVLGSIGGPSPGAYLTAVDTGAPINGAAPNAPGTTAPARLVFCGWLYAGQAAYTADGQTLLDQAVNWLAQAPSPSGTLAGTLPKLTGTFAASHTAPPVVGSLAGGLPQLVGSFVGHDPAAPNPATLAGTLPKITGSFAGTFAPPIPTVDAGVDTFNRANGRTRTGIAEAWVEYDLDDLAEREPLRIMAQQMPTPNLVDGRPA